MTRPRSSRVLWGTQGRGSASALVVLPRVAESASHAPVPVHPIRPFMSPLPRPRWYLLVAAALLAGTVTACDDPFEIKATLDVVEDTLVLNSVADASAPATAPVVLDVASQSNVFDASTRFPEARRLGSDFYSNGVGFDVAIDVRGDSVHFLPPRRVASSLAVVRRVGLRRDTVDFDAARVAPGSGYVFDSVTVAAAEGETVFIVSQHPVCANEYQLEIYAKVGVLDIDPVAKTARVRVRTDPNCGFRSFLPGVPRR